MSIWLIAALMVGSLLVLLAAGLPVAFSVGTIAVIFTFILWGPSALLNIALTAFGETKDFVMIAVPLFMLMGIALEGSGIADRLYQAAYIWFGRLRGGLAAGTVLICTLFAAMSGVSSTSTVTMGIVSFPSMLKRKYDKKLIAGSIMAGGALGILIPPSLGMITYAVFASESLGRLFAGGLIPGLLLSSLFILYILIRSYLQPQLAPSIPVEERTNWREKVLSLRSTILPILLVILVLGSIYSGIATPTEAAAVGAIGAFACAAVSRSLKWSVTKNVAFRTLSITAMIMWILIAGRAFSSVFIAAGAQDLVSEFVLSLPVNRWLIIIMMQIIWFAMGCFFDPMTITLLTIPIFVPIIRSLGFDGVWFGVLYIMNNETAFLTPPYGLNLFYLKAVAPKEVSMEDIYKSVLPFVSLQLVGLALVMVFPAIAMWLPNTLFGVSG